jgi:hypothetical protein
VATERVSNENGIKNPHNEKDLRKERQEKDRRNDVNATEQ